jgi:hypothetical protein
MLDDSGGAGEGGRLTSNRGKQTLQACNEGRLCIKAVKTDYSLRTDINTEANT